MKKQTITIALAFLFIIQSKAQNQPANAPQANIPPKTVVQQQTASVVIFNVGSVILSLDSAVHLTSGASATKNYFKAVINYKGIGTIHYQWVLINLGNTSPNNQLSIVQGTLQLSGTGTDVIFTERDHVLPNAQKRFLLEILTPNKIQSNPIAF